MDSLINRYRNITILVAILFAQILGLAIQVKRSRDDESTRLIRVWALGSITPLEKGIVWFQSSTGNVWHNYFYLRGVRQENRDLKQQIETLKLEQARLSEDARQAARLQALLGFKEQYVAHTVAAQVIGLSGSEHSRVFYIDKGSRDGIEKDMAVITANGVVGKVLRVENTTAQVLMINDQTSGVGTILETSRLQGVLRGTAAGGVVLDKIMNDEQVQPGEKALTSGGDQIFPKGLLIGTVTRAGRGADSFLDIRIAPATDLSKLEEVIVITQKIEREPDVADGAPLRAVDVLAQRLPSLPDNAAVPPASASPGTETKKTTATPGENTSVQPSKPKVTKPQSEPAAQPSPTTDTPENPPQ